MNDSTRHIRTYRPEDEDDVVSLWVRCGLTRPWNDPRKDIARKLAVQPELFLVGTIEARIAATVMAGYEGHRAWINYLGVDPVHRRRGFARTLMAEAESRLLAMGCPKVNLQVRAGNADAIALYTALGYTKDDVVSLGRRLVEDE